MVGSACKIGCSGQIRGQHTFLGADFFASAPNQAPLACPAAPTLKLSLLPMRNRSLVATLLALSIGGPSLAQKVPPPSRTVYKCEAEGKVVYSDSPCLGAKRIDVEPTRGLNKTSGSTRVGTDVRNERHSEQIAEIYRPVFGENAEQRALRHRRAKLAPGARLQCDRLDREIPAVEKTEGQATRSELLAIQNRLLRLRRQHRDLGC